MEKRKVVVAVIVSGIIGMIVAMAIRPTLGWVVFGMIFGMSLAYLLYDFREVWQKIPLAWEKMSVQIPRWWIRTDAKIRVQRPSIFFKLSCIITPLFAIVPLWIIGPHLWLEEMDDLSVLAFVVSIEFFIIFLLLGWTFSSFLLILPWIGVTRVESRFWFPFAFPDEEKSKAEKLKKLKREGLTRISPTIPLLILWTLEGIAFILIMGCHIIFSACFECSTFCLKFAWILIQLIRSRGRVASAFYCRLGIFVSCLIWGRIAESSTEVVLAILMGGIISGEPLAL